MLVAITTFLESGEEGSKTSICSVMESPECRGMGLRRSVLSGSLEALIE
jgi:predicted GNAT family N-acyltransferase